MSEKYITGEEGLSYNSVSSEVEDTLNNLAVLINYTRQDLLLFDATSIQYHVNKLAKKAEELKRFVVENLDKIESGDIY